MTTNQVFNRNDYRLKSNHKISVLVLGVKDDEVHYTHNRGVLRLSTSDFLDLYERETTNETK